MIFGFSLLFVFLILAALYESWTLPFSVLLSTPVAVFGAFGVLWLRRWLLGLYLPPYMVQIENDVYSQIGLVMLIGLAAKNAILIVEFAKDELEKGTPLADAAMQGARLRLRPILMTSLAFILGCVPLWTASGAGAVSRQIIGTTVIGGMVAASFLGIFLVPAIFYVVEKLSGADKAHGPALGAEPLPGQGTNGVKLRTFAPLIVLTLAGCTVGPNYKRPAVPVPPNFRAPDPLPPAQAESFADLKWFEVFQDPQLQKLIRAALEHNYDLRDAVARVEEARANLGITRSNQFPNFGASGYVDINRLSRNGATPIPPILLPSQNRTFGAAALQLLSFEVDIWGRLRRATEAARANLLGADENRKAVVTTLVSDVATAYLTLRELDYTLQISQRTLDTREQSLQLTKSRQSGGVATLLDLRQSQQLVLTADETIPAISQQIEQTENQITLLLGESPHQIERGRELTEQKLPPEVPPGMPSALLERRPDVRAAEQALIAANAEIGVARAAYFPEISLSGSLGGQSTQLTNLFSGPSSAWSLVPQVTQPIFTAGRLKSTVRLAEAERDEAVIQYEKAIQTAFTDVSNALIAHQRVRESRIKQEQLVVVLQDRLRLAYVRYRGGVDTQLNALDADRDLFQAQLDLAQIRLNELLSVVQLYKALGGGWQ